MKVLVTGGAGFIGSFIVDELVQKGHDVVILDNLDKQVHPTGKAPAWLNKKAEFIKGDVRNKDDVRKAMEGVEVLFHEAAAVGVGQSMYELNYYVDVNTGGTANILEFLANEEHSVKKMMVAASMSEYGPCGTEKQFLPKKDNISKGCKISERNTSILPKVLE